MSDEEATTTSADEHSTPPAGPGAPAHGPRLSLPGLIGRLGLYATYVTAAILVLVLAAAAAVLLRNPTPSLLLSLLLSIGPLAALLLSSFASYVNYYGTWRILRRQDEYQAREDLKSHAADVPQALQGALMRRSGCLPLASCLALVLSLVLATLTIVPPGIPVAGAVGAYTQQLGGLAAAARATPTPSPAAFLTSTPTAVPTPQPTPTAIPTPTLLPTAAPSPTATTAAPTPTATPCPQLQAQITSPAPNSIWYTNQTIPFAGTVSGSCGSIPNSDLTWQAVNANGVPTMLGHGTSVSASLPLGVYTITFTVFDPTTGQTSAPSITITVYQYIG